MQQQVNKKLVKERFSAGLQTYASEAVVQRLMAAELAALIKKHLPAEPLSVFEAGCGCGLLTSELLQQLDITDYTANDLVLECGKALEKIIPQKSSISFKFLPGDIENLELNTTYDLFTGNAIFQWINDLPAFWAKTAARLNNQGLVAITLFGRENFAEIAALTSRTLDYPSIEVIQNIFSPYYNILELYTTTYTLVFNTGREVLRHIRHTGTGGLAREHWGKNHLLEFEAEYRKKYSNSEGLISLTYQPIYLIAQKR